MFFNYPILFIFWGTYAYILYDQGTIVFDFQQSAPLYKMVQFNGIFQNPPQIFLAIQLIQFEQGGIQFYCDLQSITTQSSIFQEYQSIGNVIKINYFFQAFDDQRIQIINNFNMVPPINDTYAIKNANAQYAILSLLNFGCTQPIDFEIFITEIKENSISVGIRKDLLKFQNLKQVGYQILVGIEEVIQYKNMQYPIGPIAYHIVNLNTIPGNSFQFLTTYYGFRYDTQNSFHLIKETLQTYPDLSFDYTIYHQDPAVFAPCASLELYIIRHFKTIFTPIELKSAIITRGDDPNMIDSPSIKFEFNNKIMVDPGLYKIVIDKSISSINIKIEINCKNLTKILSSLPIKKNDYEQNYKVIHQCSSKLKQITFNLQFKQTKVAYQQLEIQIEEISLNIQQILYNQIEERIDLMQIQLN